MTAPKEVLDPFFTAPGLPKGRGPRRIDATDRQIDQLVYELYGLTDEEIRIVEEGYIEKLRSP